ncbi:Uncharacterised protein [Bordetella pertussis]|nr:Uncharacterised protein [Bordetella pertussis]CPK77814.1 Uncharacterised protein [Bordetella pertussis]CPN68475.1 Uncharacterised protein [Bordetella pertussis]CPP49058.1 Uncharacterised protein [Bordetella pertussis]CRD65870.1 Uncharacterised protein [Bordetella pertussis]
MAVRIDSYVAAGGNQRPAAGVLIRDALARRLGQVQPGSENLLAVDHGIHVPDEIAVGLLELLRGRRDTHLQAQRLADRPGRIHQLGHQRDTAHGQAAFIAAQGAPHLLAHQRGIEIVVARHPRGAIGLVADLLEEITRAVEFALVDKLDAGFEQRPRQRDGWRRDPDRRDRLLEPDRHDRLVDLVPRDRLHADIGRPDGRRRDGARPGEPGVGHLRIAPAGYLQPLRRVQAGQGSERIGAAQPSRIHHAVGLRRLPGLARQRRPGGAVGKGCLSRPDPRENMRIHEHGSQRIVDIQPLFQPHVAQGVERAAHRSRRMCADFQAFRPAAILRGVLAVVDRPVGQGQTGAGGQHGLFLGIERDFRAALARLEILPALHQLGVTQRAPVGAQRRRQRLGQRDPARLDRLQPHRVDLRLVALGDLVRLCVDGRLVGLLRIDRSQIRGELLDDAVDLLGLGIHAAQGLTITLAQLIMDAPSSLAVSLHGLDGHLRLLVLALQLLVLAKDLPAFGRLQRMATQVEFGSLGHRRRSGSRLGLVAQVEVLQRIHRPFGVGRIQPPNVLVAILVQQIIQEFIRGLEVPGRRRQAGTIVQGSQAHRKRRLEILHGGHGAHHRPVVHVAADVAMAARLDHAFIEQMAMFVLARSGIQIEILADLDERLLRRQITAIPRRGDGSRLLPIAGAQPVVDIADTAPAAVLASPDVLHAFALHLAAQFRGVLDARRIQVHVLARANAAQLVEQGNGRRQPGVAARLDQRGPFIGDVLRLDGQLPGGPQQRVRFVGHVAVRRTQRQVLADDDGLLVVDIFLHLGDQAAGIAGLDFGGQRLGLDA